MDKANHPSTGLRMCMVAGVAGAITLIAACAAAPLPPTSSLDAAKTAITNAEKADAGHYAGPELGEAQQKLAAADSAVLAKNMTLAKQLAEESNVEAQLASARTAAAKATAVNKEMNSGANALNDEMQRAGDKQ